MDDSGARYSPGPGRSRSDNSMNPNPNLSHIVYPGYPHSGPQMPFDREQQHTSLREQSTISEVPNYESKHVEYLPKNRMYNDVSPYFKPPSPADTSFLLQTRSSAGLTSQGSSDFQSVSLIWKKNFGRNVINITYIDSTGVSTTLQKLPSPPNCYGANVSLSIGTHFGQIDLMEDELLETIEFVVEPFRGTKQQILLNLKNPKMPQKSDIPPARVATHPLQTSHITSHKVQNVSSVPTPDLQEVIEQLKLKNQKLKQETIKLDEDLIKKILELTEWEKVRGQLDLYERENEKLKEENYHLEQRLTDVYNAPNLVNEEELRVQLTNAGAEISRLTDLVEQFEQEKRAILDAKDLDIARLKEQEHQLKLLLQEQTLISASNTKHPSNPEDSSERKLVPDERKEKDLQQADTPELFPILPNPTQTIEVVNPSTASRPEPEVESEPMQVEETPDIATPDPTFDTTNSTELEMKFNGDDADDEFATPTSYEPIQRPASAGDSMPSPLEGAESTKLLVKISEGTTEAKPTVGESVPLAEPTPFQVADTPIAGADLRTETEDQTVKNPGQEAETETVGNKVVVSETGIARTNSPLILEKDKTEALTSLPEETENYSPNSMTNPKEVGNPDPMNETNAFDKEHDLFQARKIPKLHSDPVKFNQRAEANALKKDSKTVLKKKSSSGFKTQVKGIDVYLQGISSLQSPLEDFIDKEVYCRPKLNYEPGILRAILKTKSGFGKNAFVVTMGGIEFKEPVGNSNGFYQPESKQYFKTPPDCAVFVQFVDIKVKVKTALVESTSL